MRDVLAWAPEDVYALDGRFWRKLLSFVLP